MKSRAISIIRLKRCFIYRPLATMLAALLVPMFVGFEGDAGVRASEASAAVTGGTIIRNYCAGCIPDLDQFERDAVDAYLGLHNLPLGDAHIIYDYGRADLRNAIRGVMVDILLGIISKPAAERTRHERFLYDWLQGLVRNNEIEEYKLAIAEFESWQRAPCGFTLDSVIASEYKLSYNGTPFCGRLFANVFSGPQIPDQNYFTAYGLKNSYGKPASTVPYFASLVADTGMNVAAVAGISAGIAAVVLAGAGAVLAKSLLLALAAGVGALGIASKSAAFVLSGFTVAALSPALIVAGAVAIVALGILIGVTAGIQVFSNEQAIKDLKNLSDTLRQVTNTLPDLTTFATDSSGVGIYKLTTAMAGQTLPDVPSTDMLPVHSDRDLNFQIQKSTETKPTARATLAYQDWTGINWSAQTYLGWFVQTCNSGDKCPRADSINPNIRYVDWSGVNWTAMRVGDKFINTKNNPASTDKACPPDPATGVSPGTGFSECISYLSNNIPLTAPDGVLERVSLSVLTPPAFTSASAVPFTPGQAASETVAASGNPAPQICVSSVNPPLPLDFSLNGGVCGQNGRFQLAFNGNPGSPEQIYQLTLAASNGTTTNPVLQNFAIDVSRHLAITSPPTLVGTAGFPVNFEVTTTGSPPPRLSVSPELLSSFPGLDFTDNGNGTGTFSGTPTRPGFQVCPVINGRASCGIVASNSEGSVIQGFGVNLSPAPPASLGPPTEATFIAGASNSVVLAPMDAKTHVFWRGGAAPPWTVLIDNGNGTATLLGNPPADTNGTFTVEVAPIAVGSAALLHPVFSPFTVRVVNTPAFLTRNTATFSVGSQGSFAISANEGSIGLIGTLPGGLSFTGGNRATITGIPIPGSGGRYQYELTLTDSLGTRVTLYQSLILNVFEAPSIISPNQVNFPTGLPGSFTVSTTGFPAVSAQPVMPPLTPPTGPNEGKRMFFTVTNLPATLKASNLNPQGFATGTLTIVGTPSPGEAGTYPLQITARNGFGATAERKVLLKILKLASVPASGSQCIGAYTGVFVGDIGVSSGQNCMFVGGNVIGNVTVIGGDLVLSRAKVTGNVQIQGWSEFSISSDSEIDGDLTIQDLTVNPGNDLCASRVTGNVSVLGNAIPIEIGSLQADCPGNIIGGNLAIRNNWDPIDVYNNHITRTLSCSGNLSIAGSNNKAGVKEGQCIPF